MVAWVFAFLTLLTALAGQARQNAAFAPIQDLGADRSRAVNVTISGRVSDYRDRPVTVGQVGLMDTARRAWRPLSRIGADGAYSIRAALVPGVYILVAALGPYELAEKTITIVGEETLKVALEVVREHPDAAGLLACPLANMPKEGLVPTIAAKAAAVSKPVAAKPAAQADLLPSREFFYVTDRTPVTTAAANGPRYFEDDSAPGGQLRYGTFGVQLVRRSGAGAPTASRAPISDATVFYDQLAKQATGGDVVVFVHGFRVPFDDGMIRTAQLVQGLSFSGPVVLFSWPSGDDIFRYGAGEDQILLTRPTFVRFMDELRARTKPKRVIFIAHSLGNRLLLMALERHRHQVAGPSDHVIMVAPDVWTKHFNDIIRPAVVGRVEGLTLYASSLDCALRCSASFHGGHPRLGEAGKGLVVVAGVDTVDVSTVEGNDPLGHSLYLFPAVLRDLAKLVATRDRPQRRGLVERKALNGLPFFRFPPKPSRGRSRH